MNTKQNTKTSKAWVKRYPGAKCVDGYDAELDASIVRGVKQLDAGKGIPAEEAWKELGIE